MYKSFFYLIAVVSIAALSLFFVDYPFSDSQDTPPKKNWQEPNDWFYVQRAFPDGKIQVDQYVKARKKALDMKAENLKSPLDYVPVEVPNISGRVVDIEMLGDQQTIFAGTASGGLFRSTDQGESWEAFSDQVPSLSIADLEISTDPNVMYLATGEPNAGGGSLAYDGSGIYKTTDGGLNWNPTALDYVGSIGKIVIDPENEDKVIAGLMGRLFENNSERGIYLTTDGGATWQQTLYINDSTGVIDIVMDPMDANIVYCATWTRVRRPAYRDYGGTGSGIFKSTDGGFTWNLLDAYPNNQENLGRIGLAMSQNLEQNKLYAISSLGNGPLNSFSVSDDGGESWDQKSIDDLEDVPFMWWFGSPTVDPTDENKVFYPGFVLQYTENGGNSWNDIQSTIHVDQHSTYVHPANPDLVLVGNDGGVYKSQDGGQQWEFMDGLQNLQFYTCEVNPQNLNHVYGGAQDNSTIRTLQGSNANWERILGGDGFVVQVDPDNDNIIYAEWQRGRFYKSIDGGESMNFSMSGIPNTALFNWKTPYVIDPQNPSILYIGAERVYKSTNKAENWVAVSEDLSGNPFNGNLNYGTITALDVSAVNDQFIIAGTDNGKVHISQSAGNDWEEVSDDLPDYWLTSVQADPDVDGTAYVSLSGYRYAEDEGYVYRTIDFGETWEDITANLPKIPVNEILKIPGQDLLFAATDVGLYSSPTDFIDWEYSSVDLPAIVCTDLDYHQNSNTLTVATYGRGIFQADLDLYSSTKNEAPIVDIQIYPNPSADFIRLSEELDFDQGRIFDVSGQEVLHVTSKNRTIDISTLATASYQLILYKKGRPIAQASVVKIGS